LLLLGAVLGAGGVLVYECCQATAGPPEDLPSRSWEATVYLPVNDNEGKPYPPEQWDQAVGVLVRRFQGATVGPTRRGFWLGSGQRIQSEPVRLVVVGFDHRRLDDFRTAIREVGRRLGQDSIYVRLEEPRIELITVPKAEAPKGP
jgi:hypothetical protein